MHPVEVQGEAVNRSEAAEVPDAAPVEPWARRPGPPPPVFLPHVIAMAGGLLTLLAPDPAVGLRILAYWSIAYALWMVWSRGRAYLAPSGVYFLASGVFIGLAIIYLLREGSVNELDVLLFWSVIAFTTVVSTAMVLVAFSVSWGIVWPSAEQLRASARPPAPVPPRMFQVTALAMILLSQVPPLKALNLAISGGLGLAGVLMLVLTASTRRVRMRWTGDIVLVAMVFIVPLAWMLATFEGGGRLTLAGIGVACLTAWSLVRPRRGQKVLAVAAIPLFLLFATFSRQESDLQRITPTGEINYSAGGGLASMYSPLDTWVELTTQDPDTLARTNASDIGPRWGSTFLTTLALPVPRALWDDKPLGFGAELTRILRPTLLASGGTAPEHSMAGLINSEFYVNFGVLGMVPLSLLVGWFLAKVDKAHLKVTRTNLLTVDDWWRATIVMCLVASLGDLLWVGTFTFFSRGGLAAILAWVIWKMTTRAPQPLPASVVARNQASAELVDTP
jgi:hypothetical protein